MGCQCAERTDALRRAAAATLQGDSRAIVRELSFVGRTIVQDTRTGAFQRAALDRLARFRLPRR